MKDTEQIMRSLLGDELYNKIMWEPKFPSPSKYHYKGKEYKTFKEVKEAEQNEPL